MKRMLINATQEEELRVAIVDGQKLYDLDIEVDSSRQKKANIYKGKITRVEPSLDAAFVDYGAERHGFLPLKDISREYFVKEPEQGKRINIKEVLKEGQEIVVQIDKDERGNKGAALTTFISLAGRFIVLMPNNPRGGGVSRRIAGEDREEIRRVQNKLDVPSGMSCIVRTAGISRTIEELDWDLEYLMSAWKAIVEVAVSRPAPFLVYQDSSPVIRALRDHFSADVSEIAIDDAKAYEEAREFMEQVMPHNLRRLKRYEDDVPLFTRFQIESQIESAFAHSVNLPSGGSVVIDHTEALVSIDINSARATKGGDIEATALSTNLEAADEVARQCRIRDLGGLLVIDFIDMGPNRNQREVENRLREAVRTDRARVQIGRISRFGLLEMSRQRLRRSLDESAHQVCPRCSGSGAVRSVDSLALAILRLVGEETRKERTAKVIAELPINVATFLLNEKRSWIQSIEENTGVELLLVANPNLETPNYTLRRVRDDQTLLPENSGASYTLNTPEGSLLDDAVKLSSRTTAEIPAVAGVRPETPAPAPKSVAKTSGNGGGLVAFIKKIFSASAEPEEATKPKREQSDRSGGNRSRSRRGGGNSKRDSRSSRGGGGGRGQGERGKSSSSGNRNRAQKKSDSSAQNRSEQNKGGQNKSEQNDAVQNSSTSTEENAGTGTRRRRRRRRPSGRSRGAEGAATTQGNEQAADAQQSTDQSAPRDKETRDRAPSDNGQQGNSLAATTAETIDGNVKDSGDTGRRAQGGDKTPRQTQRTPSETPAAEPKPADSAPKQPVKSQDDQPAKAAPQQQSSADSGRRLPWETSGPAETKPSYKVWSSDDKD